MNEKLELQLDQIPTLSSFNNQRYKALCIDFINHVQIEDVKDITPEQINDFLQIKETQVSRNHYKLYVFALRKLEIVTGV